MLPNKYFRLLTLLLLAGCATLRYTSDHEEYSTFKKSSFNSPELITAGSASNYSPTLSPNGAYILYTSDGSGNKDILEKKIGKGFSTKLTFHSADDFKPIMAPSGEKFAFISRRQDATGNIHIMDLGSINFQNSDEQSSESFDLPQSEETDVSWFPDDSKIVFTTRKPGESDYSIAIGDLEDFSIKVLKGLKGIHPSVSQSGDLIAYSHKGDIYIYDLSEEKAYQISHTPFVKEGQPKFLENDSALMMIRYTDDTNQDGFINADDRPTIWQVDITDFKSRIPIPSLQFEVLTNAQFSAYYPSPKGNYLYFTMQNFQSLDIYRLPSYGHIASNANFSDLYQSSQNDYLKDFYYRRILRSKLIAKDYSNLRQMLIKNLYTKVQQQKVGESQIISDQLRETFPDDDGIKPLTDLLLIKLKVQPITFPDTRKTPLDVNAEIIAKAKDIIQPYTLKIASSDQIQNHMAYIATLVLSRIKATEKDFFAAIKLLNDLEDTATLPYLSAERELLLAELNSEIVDRDTAVLRLVSVIKKNINTPSVAKKAAQIIIKKFQAEGKTDITNLAKIRDQYPDLPMLGPLCQKTIISHYLDQREILIATNELREMVNRYQNSPDLIMDALEQLVTLSPSDPHSRLGEELEKLYQSFLSLNDSRFADKAMKALNRYHLKIADLYLRENLWAKALQRFESILKFDPRNINAHRGKIETRIAMGDFSKVYEEYEDLARKDTQSGIFPYLFSYLRTFSIDQENSPSDKIDLIEDLIDDVTQAKEINTKEPRIHQTMGWLYYHRYLWTKRYYDEGGFFASLALRGKILKEYFGFGDPNWVEAAIDSFQMAYFLSEENTKERADLDQNLAEAYQLIGNHKKAIGYYMSRIHKMASFPHRSAKHEGIFMHNGGKAAFQLSDPILAGWLFEQAVQSFETTPLEMEVARNLDYLALCHLEASRFGTSAAIWRRLMRINQRLGNPIGEAIARINMAYALLKNESYGEAMTQLDQAEALIEKHGDQIVVEESDGIEIAMGAAASDVRGLSLVTRKQQIAAYRYDIMSQLNKPTQALNLLNNKKDFQVLKREESLDEGRSENYYSEEISVTYNHIGRHYAKQFAFERAAQSYFSAFEWAQKLRVEDSPIPAIGEAKNLKALARIRLSQAAQGKLSKTTLDDTYGLISNYLKSLEAVPLPRPELVESARYELTPIKLQFDLLINDELKTKVPQDLLRKTLTVDKPQEVASQLLAINLYQKNNISVAKDPPTEKVDEVSDETEDQPNSLTEEPNETLKGTESEESVATDQEDSNELQLKKKSFHTLRRAVAEEDDITWKYLLYKDHWDRVFEQLTEEPTSIPVKSPHDLFLIDQIFRHHFKKAALDSEEDQLGELFYQYLANRLVLLTRVLLPNKDFTDQLEAINDAPSPLDIAEYLSEGDRIIGLVKDLNDDYFFTIQEGETINVLEVKENELSDKLQESVAANPSGKTYVISFDLKPSWLMASNNKSNQSVTYILSPSEIPYYEESRVATPVVVTELGQTLLDLEPKGSLLELHSVANKKKIPFQTHILHLSKLTERVPSNPLHSYVELDPKNTHLESLYLGNLLPLDLDDFHALVVNQSLDQKEDETQSITPSSPLHSPLPFKENEVWHLITLLAGGVTTVTTSNVKIPDKSFVELYTTFRARSLFDFARKFNLSHFGDIGPDPIEEQEEAADLLASAIDDEEPRAALYYQRLVGDGDKAELFDSLKQLALDDSQIDTALYYQEKLMAVSDQEDAYLMGEHYKTAGELAYLSKNYEKSKNYLSKSIELLKEEEAYDLSSRALRVLALTYEKLKKYPLAIATNVKARQHYLEDDNAEESAARLHDIANQYNIFLSDYPKAIYYYDLALEEVKELDDEEFIHKINIDKANTLIVLGQVKEAIRILKGVLEFYDSGEDSEPEPTWIRSAQMLTNAYYRANQNEDALTLNTRILNKIDELDDGMVKIRFQLDATNLRGLVLARLQDFSNAFKVLRDGVSIAKNNRLKDKLAQRYNNLGFVYREAGSYKRSVETLEKALQIDQELESEAAIAYDLRNLGLGVFMLGDQEGAKQYLMESLSLSENLNLKYNAVYCHFGLGDIYKERNDFKKAKEHYQKALEIARKAFLQEFIWRALSALGDAAKKLGELEEAAAHFELALKRLKIIRPGQATAQGKTGLSTDIGIYEFFEKYIELLSEKNDIQKALYVSDLAKARGLIDVVASRNLDLSDPKQNDILRKNESFRETIEALELKRLSASLEDNQTTEWDQKLTDTTTAWLNFEQQVSKSHPLLASLLIPHSIKVEVIQKALKPDEAVLNFFVATDRVYLWLIGKKDVALYKVMIKQELLRKKLLDLKNLLENYSTIEFVSKELNDLLISKLADKLHPYSHLSIIPHGVLYYLSFAILPYEESSMVDRFKIRYLDRVSDLLAMESFKPSSHPKVLALGHPPEFAQGLSFIPKEIDAIGRSFRNIKALKRDKAQESYLKAKGQEYDIIHIAAHSEMNPINPAQSFLKLEASDEEDGKLHVSELLGQNWQSELITISSCESGISTEKRGEELFSFYNSLRMAGAKNMVTSLWRINDVASAMVMKRFYRYLAEGKPPASALQMAQIAIRAHLPHPAYWAAFKLTGGF